MKQTTDHSLLMILVALVSATVTKPVPLEAAEKPNIVLVMADDMGYEALSVNGSESCAIQRSTGYSSSPKGT